MHLRELAYYELPPERVPANLQELQSALEAAGLRGEYKVIDDTLGLTLEDGDRLLFAQVQAHESAFGPEPPGLDIACDVADEAATLIDLTEMLQEAFPGCKGSTDYEDEL